MGVLWLLESEWHLVIASEMVDKLGARDAYRKLAEVALLAPAESSKLSRIDLIGTKHPLYQGLKSVFGQAASVEGARLAVRKWGGSISKMLTYTECVESAKNVAVFVYS